MNNMNTKMTTVDNKTNPFVVISIRCPRELKKEFIIAETKDGSKNHAEFLKTLLDSYEKNQPTIPGKVR